MTGALDSIPVLAACAPMSSSTASICLAMTSVSISCTAKKPRVFWAVTAVTTLLPYTPSAANVFRSAWMPAPPPESEPAIVRALGGALRALAPKAQAGPDALSRQDAKKAVRAVNRHRVGFVLGQQLVDLVKAVAVFSTE